MITNNGLAALSGGLDIFQALWNNDMTALDALLRSGVDTQSICEDKNMTEPLKKSGNGESKTYHRKSVMTRKARWEMSA